MLFCGLLSILLCCCISFKNDDQDQVYRSLTDTIMFDEEYKIGLYAVTCWEDYTIEQLEEVSKLHGIINCKDKNNVTFLEYLMKKRILISSIISFLKNRSINIDISTDIYVNKKNKLYDLLEKSFYKFENSYKIILNLLIKRGFCEKQEIVLTKKDYLIDNWKNIPEDLKKEILCNPDLSNKVIDRQGKTLLMYLLQSIPLNENMLKMIKVNIQKNKNIKNVVDDQGNNTLHYVYNYYPYFINASKKIVTLLEQYGLGDMSNNNGINPQKKRLHISSWEKCPQWFNKISRALFMKILYGNDEIITDEERNETFIISLARCLDTHICYAEMLKNMSKSSKKKILNHQDKDGNTFLHYWCKNYYPFSAQWPCLLDMCKKYGADLTIKNNEDKIPTDYICSKGAIKAWKEQYYDAWEYDATWWEVTDTKGKNLSHHIIDTIKVEFKYRIESYQSNIIGYSISPYLFKQALKYSDPSLRIDDKTVVDKLLATDLFFAESFGMATRYNTSYIDKRDHINEDSCSDLWYELISIALKKGYDFEKNPNTSFDLLHEKHRKKYRNEKIGRYERSHYIEVELLKYGLNRGDMRKDLKDYDDAKKYDTSVNEKLVEIYKKLASANGVKNFFIRGLSSGYITKIWTKMSPIYFSPYETYTMAAKYGCYKSVSRILNSFDYDVLINFYALTEDKKPPYKIKYKVKNHPLYWKDLNNVYKKEVEYNPTSAFVQKTKEFLSLVYAVRCMSKIKGCQVDRVQNRLICGLIDSFIEK